MFEPIRSWKNPALEWHLKGRTKQPKASDENCHSICHGMKLAGFAWLWPQVEHNLDGFIYNSLENFFSTSWESGSTQTDRWISDLQKCGRPCNSEPREMTRPPVFLERNTCCMVSSSCPKTCNQQIAIYELLPTDNPVIRLKLIYGWNYQMSELSQ